MLYTTDMLRDQLQNYSNPMTKISRLIKDGTYIPINRGLYVKEKNIPGYVLAGAIYGPSYLSFDFVLAWYGLIPETVQTFTSATLNKRKHKRLGIISESIPTAMFLRLPIRWVCSSIGKETIIFRWQLLRRPCATRYIP